MITVLVQMSVWVKMKLWGRIWYSLWRCLGIESVVYIVLQSSKAPFPNLVITSKNCIQPFLWVPDESIGPVCFIEQISKIMSSLQNIQLQLLLQLLVLLSCSKEALPCELHGCSCLHW
jgi:hypothetical protein